MLLQGTYFAHLTRLKSLWMMFERDQSVPHDPISIPDDLVLELAPYPASLRNIEVVLADAIFVFVQSYPTACPGSRIAFRATEDARCCSVALSDAADRLLAGQHIELGSHILSVYIDTASPAAECRSVATCLLDWVAQSGAQSVTIQPPLRTGFGRAMTLRGLVATEAAHMRYIVREKLHNELSRACGHFELMCSAQRSGIELARTLE